MVNTLKNGFVRADARLPWPPPSSAVGHEKTRLIPFQIWNLAELKELAQKQLALAADEDDVLVAVTSQCSEDMQNEELSHDDVAQMVVDLLPEDYVNSSWCEKSAFPSVKVHPDALWVPCDAYAMPTVSIDKYGREIHKTYYLKMCKSLTGTVLLLVSVHKSKYE